LNLLCKWLHQWIVSRARNNAALTKFVGTDCLCTINLTQPAAHPVSCGSQQVSTDPHATNRLNQIADLLCVTRLCPTIIIALNLSAPDRNAYVYVIYCASASARPKLIRIKDLSVVLTQKQAKPHLSTHLTSQRPFHIIHVNLLHCQMGH